MNSVLTEESNPSRQDCFSLAMMRLAVIAFSMVSIHQRLYFISALQVQQTPVDRRCDMQRRKTFVQTLVGSSLLLSPFTAIAEDINVVKTPSGLKYLDLAAGTGKSPAYGEMVTLSYKAYVKLPQNAKKYPTEPQLFDKVDEFLFKHGSGKMIPGFDEGLHTMREGGTRRILIPPKLGFIDIGLGPIPTLPWNRSKLNKLIDQMVELSGGTLIYEVTLNGVYQDEVDQGYYSDSSLTPEEFDTLRKNLQQKGNAARLEEEAAAKQPPNADKVV